MSREKKDSARKVPFFARYLVGQEIATAESAKSADGRGPRASKATLKYPSDWDEWDDTIA